MQSDNVVGRWTGGVVKMVGIWLGPDRWIEKNWNGAASNVVFS